MSSPHTSKLLTAVSQKSVSNFEFAQSSGQFSKYRRAVRSVIGESDLNVDLTKVSLCRAFQEYDLYECKECGYVSVRPVSKCNDPLCPTCQWHNNKRRSAQRFRELHQYGKPILRKIRGEERVFYSRPFPKFIFTLPENIARAIKSKREMNAFRDVCRRTLEEFFGGKVGGIRSPHTWADNNKEGFRKWFPHYEYVLVPWKSVNGKVQPLALRGKKSVRCINPNDLARLREIYKEALRRSRILPNPGEDKDLNIHFSTISTPSKLIHTLKYHTRPPVHSWSQLFSLDPDEIVSAFRHQKLWSEVRSGQRFGLASRSSPLFDLCCNQAEVTEPNSELDPNECPCCGGDLVKVCERRGDEIRILRGKDPPDLFKRAFDIEVKQLTLPLVIKKVDNFEPELTLKAERHWFEGVEPAPSFPRFPMPDEVQVVEDQRVRFWTDAQKLINHYQTYRRKFYGTQEDI